MRPGRAVRRAAALGLVLAAGATGAAPGGTAERTLLERETGTMKWPWHGCIQKSDRATIVQLRTSDGVRIAGAIFGKGSRGVVLAHEGESTLCNWAPFARTLAHAGFRALAYDSRWNGLSARPRYPKNLNLPADAAAAAKELRRRGARSVVLGGASMGGAAVVVAGVTIRPPVSGVVSLSAPLNYVRVNTEAAATKLRAPVLFVGAQDDRDYASIAETLFSEAASADKRLEIVAGSEHGTRMLRSGAVSSLVLAWIRDHSPAANRQAPSSSNAGR